MLESAPSSVAWYSKLHDRGRSACDHPDGAAPLIVSTAVMRDLRDRIAAGSDHTISRFHPRLDVAGSREGAVLAKREVLEIARPLRGGKAAHPHRAQV